MSTGQSQVRGSSFECLTSTQGIVRINHERLNERLIKHIPNTPLFSINSRSAKYFKRLVGFDIRLLD